MFQQSNFYTGEILLPFFPKIVWKRLGVYRSQRHINLKKDNSLRFFFFSIRCELCKIWENSSGISFIRKIYISVNFASCRPLLTGEGMEFLASSLLLPEDLRLLSCDWGISILSNSLSTCTVLICIEDHINTGTAINNTSAFSWNMCCCINMAHICQIYLHFYFALPAKKTISTGTTINSTFEFSQSQCCCFNTTRSHRIHARICT